MIHLIVGNTGAGKTTYSKQLKEETNGIIFSIDTWNNTLFMPDKKPTDGLHWFLERIDRVEVIIQNLVVQLEASNTATILDLGLSKYEHREKFRTFAQANNFESKLHFLDIPAETRWKRIASRNTEKGETFEFEVTRENFEFMETWFETPTSEELKDGITINL